MINLSAFIITKNEEKNIARAINSLKSIASEIIVVDSGSTDDTVQIAKSLGAKVVYNEWPGYIKQKSYAESLCVNDWVLNLDADEELSKDLSNEIEFLLSSSLLKKYDGYSINFVILHRTDTYPRPLAPANRFIRMYDRNKCGFVYTSQQTTTHDAVSFNLGDKKPKIYKLDAAAYHRSGSSIEQLVTKANFYSGEQAKDFVNQKRKVSNLRMLLEIPVWFIKAFFIRRYFVFGMDGFVDSVIFAFARFLKLAKARDLYSRLQKKEDN